MKHVCLLLFATVLCEAQVLTLTGAVELAVKENRNVRISALDVAKAGQAVAETKTARLPQFSTYILGGETLNSIDFSVPKGALGVYPSTGPIPAQDSNISTPRAFNAFIFASAAQPITQLHKIGLAISESRLGEEMAREHLRQRRQETTRPVNEAYYQVVHTQTQISSAQESLKYLVVLPALP